MQVKIPRLGLGVGALLDAHGNPIQETSEFPIFMPIGKGAASNGKTITKGDYSNLADSPTVDPGNNFTQTQKANIYQQNMGENGGVLRSDLDGQELVMPRKSQPRVTPPPNEAQIDHIVPKKLANPDMAPGTNSYSNAQVLSREQNR